MLNITSEQLVDLERLFESRFPEREIIHIENFEELVAGWETEIYSFSLHYQEKTQPKKDAYIIRFYFGAGQNQQAVHKTTKKNVRVG